MAFNGSGTYAAPASTWNPAVAGTAISATDWAALLADIETALTTAICKDGQSTASAYIPFAAGLSSKAGAVNSPAFFMSTDTTTGFYRPAANQIGVTIAGVLKQLTTATDLTLSQNLLFTDATYDIGASGATRPRDFFLSRNATVGGTLALTGALTYGGVALTAAVTGTGKMVLDTSPTFTTSMNSGATFTAFAGATTLLTLGGTGGSSVVAIPGTKTATNSTTASVTLAGGLAVADNLYVGNGITAGAISGTTGTFSSTLLATGGAIVSKDLTAYSAGVTGGAIYLQGLDSTSTNDNLVTLKANALAAQYSNLQISVQAADVNTMVATFTSAGINGVLGGTTPAAATVTTLSASGQSTLSTSDGSYNLLVKDARAYSAGTTGGRLALYGNDSTSVVNVLGSIISLAVASQHANLEFKVMQSGSASNWMTVTGATLAVTIPGTLGVTGEGRLAAGVRIGADSTNNLLDDASTGAGTATLYIGNASINVTSDERLKSGIAPLEDGLSIVNALQPIEYDQDEERPFGHVRHYVGFGARHSHKVAPWAVHTQGDTGLPWQMRQEFLMAPAVRAIQQLDERLRKLEMQ